MPDEFPYDLFLSHNHADKPRMLLPVSPLSTLNPQPSTDRRFIPLLLGDCALLDALRRYKVVDFREESEAAFAEVLATGQAGTGAMKRRFGLPHEPEGRACGGV